MLNGTVCYGDIVMKRQRIRSSFRTAFCFWGPGIKVVLECFTAAPKYGNVALEASQQFAEATYFTAGTAQQLAFP